MGYKTQSPDVTREEEQLHIEHLRRIGLGGRLEMMREMSRVLKKIAWDELQSAHPDLSPRELQVKAVELWYGAELAERFEAALKERGKWN